MIRWAYCQLSHQHTIQALPGQQRCSTRERTARCGWSIGSYLRTDQPVVVRVSADPDPSHSFPGLPAEGAIVVSDPNTEAIFTSLQATKPKRWMPCIPLPQMIVLDCEILNFNGEGSEELPESPGAEGFHSCGGHSRRRPLVDSLSASSKSKSSLPEEESESNWSSHRFCSRARNQWTMRRYSAGGRPSIAASISSTRLMFGVYHGPALG